MQSLLSDDWQLFITSGAWTRFLVERIQGGYLVSEHKAVAEAARIGDVHAAAYHQGIIDGINRLIEIISKYHIELSEAK